MKTRCLLVLFAQCAVFAFGLVSAGTAGSGIITFQESSDASRDSKQQLVGHWRKTTIVFESPKDEHLVLRADGTAENWVVTAESRSEPVTGRWSVEGKTLTLSFGENENSRPFTFYQGQLVYEYKTPQGPMANEGEGSGIATIEGDTAIFKPEGSEEECQITLKFTGSKLVVTQTGICGFGHNVSAEGTYKKVSSKKPKFGSD